MFSFYHHFCVDGNENTSGQNHEYSGWRAVDLEQDKMLAALMSTSNETALGLRNMCISGFATSAFTDLDQAQFDGLLNDHLNIIPPGKLFDEVKDRENKYHVVSRDYYEKWKKGEVETSSEIRSWMNSYSILFGDTKNHEQNSEA